MKEINNLTVYISIGSFVISCLGFLNSIRQTSYTRKIEKLKAYDKIYYDVCDMLLFEYKKTKNKPYTSDEKDLERAVNEFSNLHWIEQMYGRGHYDYKNFESEDERIEFNRRVAEEHRNHKSEILNSFPFNQSPVLHLNDEEFKSRFVRVMEHLKDNISYFSPSIRKEWEKISLRSTDDVRNEYEALARVNLISCEEIKEDIDDPYLKIFLGIRHYHRLLNRTQKESFHEVWYYFTSFFLRPYRKWRRRKYY